MQGVDPGLARAVDFVRAAYAVPAIRSVVDSFLLLSGASGAFWLLSKLCGALAAAIHDSLDFSLAVLFAVSYNLVLAVLYAAVIASAVALTGKGGTLYVWYKIVGFLFVYVMLKVVYVDHKGQLDEYGLPGYLAGVASYIFFVLRPETLRHPVATRLYDVVYFLMQGDFARLLTALGILRALFAFARFAARTIIAGFGWLGARLSRKAMAALPVFLV